MVIYLKKGDVNMDEKLDELIVLAKKQNKTLSTISGWLTFFGVLTILYMVLQVINFFLSFPIGN